MKILKGLACIVVFTAFVGAAYASTMITEVCESGACARSGMINSTATTAGDFVEIYSDEGGSFRVCTLTGTTTACTGAYTVSSGATASYSIDITSTKQAFICSNGTSSSCTTQVGSMWGPFDCASSDLSNKRCRSESESFDSCAASNINVSSSCQSCTPDCTGLDCGADDGCGGSCGTSTDNGCPCDDSTYCNGTDTYSSSTCVHSGDPCTSPNTCNETTNTCDAPATGSITIMENNPECTGQCDPSGGILPELVARIGAATSTVDCQVYGFDNPGIKTALIQADQGGTTVRFVTDDENADPASKYYTSVQELISGGVDVKYVNSGGIMHTKYCIFDGQDVFSGTMNFTTTCVPVNHNFVAIVDDNTETAGVFQCNFNESWNYCGNGTNGSCAPSQRTTNCNDSSINVGGTTIEVCFSPQGTCMSKLSGTATHTSGYLGTCAENPCSTGQVCSDYKYNNDGVTENRHSCDSCDATGTLPAAATTRQAFSVFFFTDVCAAKAIHDSAAPLNYALWDALGAQNAYSADGYLCNLDYDVYIENWAGKNHSKIGVFDDSLLIGSMNWSANGDQGNDEQTLIIHNATLATQVYNEIAQDVGRLTASNVQPCTQQSTEVCTDGSDNNYNGLVDYCDAGCACASPAANCLSCNDAPTGGGTDEDGAGGGVIDCNTSAVAGEFCELGGTYSDSTDSSVYTGQNADDVIKFVNNSEATTLDACTGIDATEAANLAAGSFSSIDGILAVTGISTSESDNDLDYLKACAPATASCTTSSDPECSGTAPVVPAGYSCDTVCIDSRDGSCYCQGSDANGDCYDANCDPSLASLSCSSTGTGTYKCSSTGQVDTSLLRNATVTFKTVKNVTSEVHTNTKWYAFDETGLVYEEFWCESPHPYTNSCGYGVSGCANDAMYFCSAYRSNAQKIAVWFAGIDTEACECNSAGNCVSGGGYTCVYDPIDMKNSSGTHVAYYGGPFTANTYLYGWSAFVTGTTANLYFDTDSIISDWGFAVSAVAYQPPSSTGTPTTTTCVKVKGVYQCN